MRKDELLQIRLSKELKAKLHRVAAQRDLPASYLIREFIRRLKEVDVEFRG